MQIYKREEGMWARVPVAIVGGIVTVFATRSAMRWGSGTGRYIWAGIAFLLFACATLFLAFFHQKTSEVLIETENEMRKVVWPTRDEVTGSTVVVIATVVLLGVSIFSMDVALGWFLSLIGLY